MRSAPAIHAPVSEQPCGQACSSGRVRAGRLRRREYRAPELRIEEKPPCFKETGATSSAEMESRLRQEIGAGRFLTARGAIVSRHHPAGDARTFAD